jgi:porin
LLSTACLAPPSLPPRLSPRVARLQRPLQRRGEHRLAQALAPAPTGARTDHTPLWPPAESDATSPARASSAAAATLPAARPSPWTLPRRPGETQHEDPEQASGPPLAESKRLGGSLFGLRDVLDEAGLDLEIVYTIESVSVASGGIRRRTEVLDNLDLLLTADLEAMLGWKHARVLLYGLGNHGGDPTRSVGDFQATSNIEAPDAFRPYEAWFEQSTEKDRWSVLVGLYDITSEFDIIPAAGLFIHSSPGTGAEFAASGRNGASTFPFTSLAARGRVRPAEWCYLQAVVADGVPANPARPRSNAIRFDDGDGVLLTAEFGVFNLPSSTLRRRTRARYELPNERQYGHFGKFAVGVWGYTSRFQRLGAGANGTTRGSTGAYVLAEQRVYHEQEDERQGLALFARAGVADDRVQVLDRYLGAGAVYRGALPTRGADELGFAVSAARFGVPYRRSVEEPGRPFAPWEIAFELTYRIQITPALWIQPDLQYVVDPGGDPTIDDALVVGLRGQVAL